MRVRITKVLALCAVSWPCLAQSLTVTPVPYPRGAGQQFFIVGDSIAANGGTSGSSNGSGYARPGYVFTTWFTALLGEKINLDPAYNLGVGGTYTSQITATVPAALALPCQWVICQGWTNYCPRSAQATPMPLLTRTAGISKDP